VRWGRLRILTREQKKKIELMRLDMIIKWLEVKIHDIEKGVKWMLKQFSSKIKNALAILLAALFVVFLTAVPAYAINGDQKSDNFSDSSLNPHWQSGESNVSSNSYWKGVGYEGCWWIFQPSTNQWIWTCYD